ncbi:MAG: hypothetical protein QCI38_06505, partial [Candidatus Thermoplasmatota archaeon]|nr:hypothetical protein [Candidatus Thermoplasmatota archaeon]
MAYRILLTEGGLFCSTCKAPVTASTTVCASCGAALDDTISGKNCPNCSVPLPETAKECSKCGIAFQTGEAPAPVDDEEFLSRLLEWGQKVTEKKDTTDDKLEQQLATETFAKAVGGQIEILDKDTLAIRQGAEEKKRIEERTQKIQTISAPLEMAAQKQQEDLSRKKSELEDKKSELEVLKKRRGIAVDKKRQRLEKEIELLEDEIQGFEKRGNAIQQMDDIHKTALTKTQEDLKKKEKELELRLAEFQKEIQRRDADKKSLEVRENNLKAKEQRIAQWEAKVVDREKKLKAKENEIAERENQLVASAETEVHAESPATPESKGLSPEEWLAAQKKIQAELFSISSDSPDVEEAEIAKTPEEMADLATREVKIIREDIETKNREMESKEKEIQEQREKIETLERRLGELQVDKEKYGDEKEELESLKKELDNKASEH